jgi:hypothetical protein
MSNLINGLKNKKVQIFKKDAFIAQSLIAPHMRLKSGIENFILKRLLENRELTQRE